MTGLPVCLDWLKVAALRIVWVLDLTRFLTRSSRQQCNIKGGQSLQNREKRFKKFISDGPGPASYDRSYPGTLAVVNRKTLEAKERLQSKMSRALTVSRSVYVPSIPFGRSYGYDINEDDSIVKHLPPAGDSTLGPAYYKPQIDFSNATLKYKGIHFGNSLGRLQLPITSGPGPGQYDITQKKSPRYENVNIKKDQQQNSCSNLRRLYEVKILKEEKELWKIFPGFFLDGCSEDSCDFGVLMRGDSPIGCFRFP